MIKFIGGASKVTGSAFLVETPKSKVLIDYGAEQEGELSIVEVENRVNLIPHVDCAIVTHAHIDHCGMIPFLVKKKKTNSIISTPATKDLSDLMLRDFAKIQAENEDAPVFSENDVQDSMILWDTKDENKKFQIAPDITATFYGNSHIIGSVSVMLETPEGNYLFASDVGTSLQQLMDYPPTLPKEGIDYLIIESTYGNKNHNQGEREKLLTIVNETCKKGGKVIIPAFAVGRLQEILYLLSNAGIKYPIYIDTPMGMKVTQLLDDYRLYLKKKLRRVAIENGIFGDYKTINTSNQSRELARSKDPCVVISASGMLEGGRVLNHLETVRKDKKSALVFVGYQANGTKGRRIVDGEEKLECAIHRVSSFSAHADQKELLEYITRLPYAPYKVYLVHGEDEQRKALREKVRQRKIRVETPENLSESGGNHIESKKTIITANISFAKFAGYELAPFAGYIVSYEDRIEVVDSSWYDRVFKDMERAINATVSHEMTEEVSEEIAQVAMGISEIKNNIDMLFSAGILTKKRIKEYWDNFTVGPTAAKKYISNVHFKNPNTGKRRWHMPTGIEEDEIERLYDVAYRSLIALSDLSRNDVYKLLVAYDKNL